MKGKSRRKPVLEQMDLSDMRVIAQYSRGFAGIVVVGHQLACSQQAALGEDLINMMGALKSNNKSQRLCLPFRNLLLINGLFSCKLFQLKACLNATGERLVLVLNNLVNDCGYSKPNSYAISLTDKVVVDSFSFAFSINFS